MIREKRQEREEVEFQVLLYVIVVCKLLSFLPFFFSLSSVCLTLSFQKQKSVELRRREEGKQLEESRRDRESRRNQTWITERKKAKEEEKKAKDAVSVPRLCVCVCVCVSIQVILHYILFWYFSDSC